MKVGVIGTGSMGQNHVRVLSEISTLIGVCDSNPETGEKIAAKFKTKYHKSVESLLEAGVEAVSVVTPTNAHYDISKKVLASGVHLLLEKPATGVPEKINELSKLAERNGVVFAVGFIERHNPVVSFAKKNLEGGTFGSLISASARRVSSFPSRIKDVGVIMDLGVHDIDIIKYLAGAPAKSVFATAGRFMHKEFEDHANIIIEFENGITGTIEVNWLTPTKVRSISMTCSGQFVEFDYTTQSIDICSATLREFDPANLFDLGLEYQARSINLKKEEPLRRELVDFIKAAEEHRPPLVSGNDAAETISIAEAAIKSSKTNSVVRLK
jgi:UDP-N-acetylglucosamine 3-dehydrogenase